MLSAQAAEEKMMRENVEIAIGVQFAKLALWKRTPISQISQIRQVEVVRDRNKHGYEEWVWHIASGSATVAALVEHWDGTRADRSLFNPANFVCSCNEENRSMCAHKVATMIAASSSPVTVAKAMGYRVNITGDPVEGLLAGEK